MEKLKLPILLLLTLVLVTACGDEDTGSEQVTEAEDQENMSEENTEEETEELTEVRKESEEDDAETEEESDEPDTDSSGNGDFDELITYMEDATEGTADLILENEEDQTFDVDDDFTVSLDAFQLVELNGIHTNFEIPFNDQTDGGVLIAQYTVTNDLDDDAYYMPTFDISYTGAQKAHSGNRDLLPEEEQIITHLAPDNDYHIEAGESITGFYAYPFGEDELEDLMNEGTIEIEMPSALSEPEAYDSTIGSNGQMNVDLNEEASGEESESDGDFYEDGATATNMGEKEMIQEAEDIGESEELEDYTVELEGYQFTEFTPNSDEEPRFADFDNGVVLLTVKFNIDNQGSETIGLSPLSSTLTVNDGSQWLTGEGMLLDYSVDDVIESGDSGEVLQVYTLDQEQYEEIWEDKAFEVEFGPIRDEDAQDISKGHTAEFVLPE